jgi:DNA-binding transcriptional ArsR family regulator
VVSLIRVGALAVYSLTGISPATHIDQVTETFAALAEPNRFRIVELLRAGARSVNEIGDRLELNQPQVSKHLRVLKEAGLVEVEARAQQRVYELRAKPLRELHDWLERYRKLWDARFDALDGLLVELEAKQASQAKPAKKEKLDEPRRRK